MNAVLLLGKVLVSGLVGLHKQPQVQQQKTTSMYYWEGSPPPAARIAFKNLFASLQEAERTDTSVNFSLE